MARELEDGLAASSGIELRRPLYAPAMVDWALATPERFKLRGSTGKYVHRLAMTGMLPDRILARADKADFMVTFRLNLNELHSSDWAELVEKMNWVLSGEANRMCDRVGDPSYGGVPEWQLWTLMGCCALTSA
jgi:asparagine synthase (glutamine-hydrolysing)